MSHSTYRLGSIALVALCIFAGASCTTENKPAGEGTATVAIRPGEAGGVVQGSFTASATVRVIDPATRRITLTDSEGKTATLVAGPEVRNFDQIRVGDKISATVVETLYVFVRGGDDPNSIAHAAAVAAAPKGAKPGVLVAEAYEIVATIKSIDPVARKATLQFVDGSTKTVTPRADVELSRYKAGDQVVIQVSQVIGVVVEKP